MGNWLMCPNNGSRKVSIEVCLRRCEKRAECSELQELPREELHAVMRKLNLPIPEEDTESVIQIENREVDEGEQTNGTPSSATCGKSPGSPDNDTEFKSQRANDFCKLPTRIEVIEPRVGTEKAMEMYERLLLLKKDIEVKFIEMGELLNEFYDHKYYTDVGYEEWEQFCSEALGFSARWALDIRKIATKKEKLKLSDRDVAEVGIKKMAQILPMMINRKTADHWIKEAKKLGVTAEKLNAKVRVAQGKITEEEAKILPVKVLLSLSPEQKEIWDRTIEVGKRITASESVSHIVTGAIFPEFLSTYPSGDEFESKAEFVSMALMTFEAAYNVKVLGEIVDVKSGEILITGK